MGTPTAPCKWARTSAIVHGRAWLTPIAMEAVFDPELRLQTHTSEQAFAPFMLTPSSRETEH
jgi:hypothetical protein